MAADSARTLFRIPFRSAMGDADANRLRQALDMTLHLRPKHPAAVPPLGVAVLDLDAGLYLVRGEGEGEWALECRAWGDHAASVVAQWQGQAILAARRLDPTAAGADAVRPCSRSALELASQTDLDVAAQRV